MFNRSLFGLLATSEGIAPDGAKEAALQDLKRARELDYDVKDFWLDRKITPISTFAACSVGLMV